MRKTDEATHAIHDLASWVLWKAGMDAAIRRLQRR